MFKGFWDRDMQSGYGKELLADGSSYQGNDVKGQRFGLGKFTWADGFYFEGNLGINFEMTGSCIYHWKDGRIFKGEWLENKMRGIGIYIRFDNKQYIGEY